MVHMIYSISLSFWKKKKMFNEISLWKEFADRFTIDAEVYTVQSNGGKLYDAAESTKVGNYNWLLDSCPKDLYDNSKASFDRAFWSVFFWGKTGLKNWKSTIGKSRMLCSTTHFQMGLHSRFWKFFLPHQKLDFRGVIGANSQARDHFC